MLISSNIISVRKDAFFINRTSNRIHNVIMAVSSIWVACRIFYPHLGQQQLKFAIDID